MARGQARGWCAGRAARGAAARRARGATGFSLTAGLKRPPFLKRAPPGLCPARPCAPRRPRRICPSRSRGGAPTKSEEHTSELQSHLNLVCRLLLEKKKKRHCLKAPPYAFASSISHY